ncbi:MAG TPA: hypothetical protein VGR47_14735 [Terracidiphilus sp.]|nr:hypothetical protein [Terracidiphilus sp.]
MTNMCIRLPERTYRRGRVYAALHNMTVTDLVRLFLDDLPNISAAKLGVPSARSAARSAAARGATTPAAPRAIVTARPTVTLRFSDENFAPATVSARRPAP